MAIACPSVFCFRCGRGSEISSLVSRALGVCCCCLWIFRFVRICISSLQREPVLYVGENKNPFSPYGSKHDNSEDFFSMLDGLSRVVIPQEIC